jgi:hypothetical protein
MPKGSPNALASAAKVEEFARGAALAQRQDQCHHGLHVSP